MIDTYSSASPAIPGGKFGGVALADLTEPDLAEAQLTIQSAGAILQIQIERKRRSLARRKRVLRFTRRRRSRYALR